MSRRWSRRGPGSCAGAGSWKEIQLDTNGGSDMRTAPDAGGYFVGDYESIAPNGSSGFRPLWVQAQPQPTHGPTDLLTSTVSGS